jgi:hypothetical protein
VAARTQPVEHGGEWGPERWALGLPKSARDIERIHQAKKALAVERAKQSKFLGKLLSGIDPRKLDDPEEWSKIPVLTKDELRKLSTEEFYGDFCIAGFDRAVEFWRSGGATGKPLFYPRSAQDMRYMLGVSFRRIWPCIGAGPGDVVHVAFPMGIHPVGQLTPRSAEMEGLATVWAGSGTTTPSDIQLELILSLKPSIVAAMPSYALHLANLAEARGIDLAASSVTKVRDGRAGYDAALVKHDYSLPALAHRRHRAYEATTNEQRSVLGFPDSRACAPYRGFLQGPRRQYKSRRSRGFHVRADGHPGFQRGGGDRS